MVVKMCVMIFTGLTLALANPSGVVAQTGTLVVANMSDATVTVIDVQTGGVLATLPTGIGPHEVAVSHDGRRAVVTIMATGVWPDGVGYSVRTH